MAGLVFLERILLNELNLFILIHFLGLVEIHRIYYVGSLAADRLQMDKIIYNQNNQYCFLGLISLAKFIIFKKKCLFTLRELCTIDLQ